MKLQRNFGWARPAQFRMAAIAVCIPIALYFIFWVAIILPVKHADGNRVDTGIFGWYIWQVDNWCSTAGIYYRSQLPMFIAQARKWKIDWYWEWTEPVDRSLLDATYFDLIHVRMKSMQKRLIEFKRDDFALEKDKCVMLDFFDSNKIPHAPVLGHWLDKAKLIEEIESGAFAKRADPQKFPIFIKACHITQGSASSVMKIPSLDWIEQEQNTKKLKEFVEAMWILRADDVGRPWRAAHNQLTDTLTPAMFLQGPATTVKTVHACEGYANKCLPFSEVRVEVLWGRAFMGMVSEGPPTWGCAFMRGPGPNGLPLEVQPFDKWATYFNHHKYFGNQCSDHPLVVAGNFDCIWELAERVAFLSSIDQMRVDIFVAHEETGGRCMLNEISLSSGFPNGAFQNYLTKLWALPHITGEYQVVSTSDGTPVYKHTATDLPTLESVKLVSQEQFHETRSGAYWIIIGISSMILFFVVKRFKVLRGNKSKE